MTKRDLTGQATAACRTAGHACGVTISASAPYHGKPSTLNRKTLTHNPKPRPSVLWKMRAASGSPLQDRGPEGQRSITLGAMNRALRPETAQNGSGRLRLKRYTTPGRQCVACQAGHRLPGNLPLSQVLRSCVQQWQCTTHTAPQSRERAIACGSTLPTLPYCMPN